MVGYVATAGISIAIVTIYFFTAHRPTSDPFRKEGNPLDHVPSASFRPNVVDETILDLAGRPSRWIYAKLGRKHTERPHNPRLEEAFIKVRTFMNGFSDMAANCHSA